MANECCRPVNRRLRAAIPIALALLASARVLAGGVVTVNQPWVRPGAAHAATPLYLVLGSSEAATITAARSPVGEVALMRGQEKIGEIAIAPGTPLAMTPDGPHLVIRRLAQPLAIGARVPLTLVLRDAAGATRDIEVSAEVRLRSPLDDERRAHGHAHARADAAP